jgi:hypothetical protein
MPTEPDIPQQLQPLYYLVILPIATVMTTITYFLGKRWGGGEGRGADKERERLKEEVATLLRKTERNQTDRDIDAQADKIREEVQQVVKSLRESFEVQFKELNRHIVALRQQVGRLSRKQPK